MLTDGDELKPLLWRCRRGTRELELVLTRYLQPNFSLMDSAEKRQFQQLLALQDTVLTEWLIYHNNVDSEFAGLVNKILSVDGSGD